MLLFDFWVLICQYLIFDNFYEQCSLSCLKNVAQLSKNDANVDKRFSTLTKS